MKTKCSFTIEHYREVLEKASKAYSFRLFSERDNKKPDTPVIYLRHDMDHSLSMAHQIATLEYELNIRSTYFVQLHSNFYNPVSDSEIKVLKDIFAMGHEIGFHYDLDFYMKNCFDVKKAFISDKLYLEELIGAKIKSVSRHFPHRGNDGGDKFSISDFSLFDAYSTQFTKEIKYISESSHSWREGCFCEHLDKKRDIQILIHPVWWAAKGNSWQEKLIWAHEKESLEIKEKVSQTIDYYSEYLKNR